MLNEFPPNPQTISFKKSQNQQRLQRYHRRPSALTTAQLYSLSSRRHRDESRESVRRAQEERDRVSMSLEQSQQWLERANEHLQRMEENARESQREYLDAKSLLVRVRQAVSGVDGRPPPRTGAARGGVGR